MNFWSLRRQWTASDNISSDSHFWNPSAWNWLLTRSYEMKRTSRRNFRRKNGSKMLNELKVMNFWSPKNNGSALIFTVFHLYWPRDLAYSEIFFQELTFGLNPTTEEDIKPELLAQEPLKNVNPVRSYEPSNTMDTVNQRNRNFRNN